MFNVVGKTTNRPNREKFNEVGSWSLGQFANYIKHLTTRPAYI
jgi:hypothetical protein